MTYKRGESACFGLIAGVLAAGVLAFSGCSPSGQGDPASLFKVELSDISELPADTKVIPNEWLIEVESELSAEDLSRQLQVQGLDVESVRPLVGQLTSLGEAVRLQGLTASSELGQCRLLYNRLYKVKFASTEGGDSESQIRSLEGVSRVEPHLLIQGPQSNEDQSEKELRSLAMTLDKGALFRKIRQHAEKSEHLAISILAASYLRRFFEEGRTVTRNALRYYFEALLQLRRWTELVGIVSNAIPDPVVAPMTQSSFAFSFKNKLDQELAYEYWWKILIDTRSNHAQQRLEDALLSSKDFRYSSVAKLIRNRRAEIQRQAEEEEKRIANQNKLELYKSQGEWLSAARLLNSVMKNEEAAWQLLQEQWMPSHASEANRDLSDWKSGISLYLSLAHKFKTAQEYRAYLLGLVSSLSSERREILQTFVESLYFELSDGGKKDEHQAPEALAVIESLLRHYPESSWVTHVQQQRVAHQEMLAAQERQRVANIKSLKDPFNTFVWAYHSEMEVIRNEAKDFVHRLLGKGEKPKQRYDLRLREALSTQDLSTMEQVLVAVVDSGVDDQHPDLKSVIHPEIPGASFVQATPTKRWQDDNGHGTHVAGTIAAAFDGQGISGVNPKASILPVKVLNREGSGSIQAVINGVVYAQEMGAKVINLSLGSRYYSEIANSIYNCIGSQGIVIVAAAGNSNAFEAHYPSDYESVISVAASDYQGKRGHFSNFGTGVDITAPGVQILSAYPVSRSGNARNPYFKNENQSPYAVLNGTSMASPMVAGAASLLISKYPQLSADQVRAVLFSSAQSLAADGEKNAALGQHYPWDYRLLMGDGLVNLEQALKPLLPRPWLRLRNSSETFNHDLSFGDESSRELILSLQMQNLWKTAGAAQISIEEIAPALVIAKPREAVGLSYDRDQIDSLAEGQDLEISAHLKFKKMPQESQTRLFKIKAKGEGWENTDYFSLHLESFMRIFQIPGRSQAHPSRPDTGWWLEFAPEWGLFAEAVKENNETRIWSGALLKTDSRMSNETLYLTQTDMQGRQVGQTNFMSQGIGLRPSHILSPRDLDGDGRKEVLAYSAYFSSSSGFELKEGFTAIQADGSTEFLIERSKGGLVSFDAEDRLLAAVLRNEKQPSWSEAPHDNYKEGQLIQWSLASRKEIARHSLSWLEREDPKVHLCHGQTVLTFGSYSGEDRFPKEANQTQVWVLSAEGKLLAKKVLDGFNFYSSVCTDLQTLLIQTRNLKQGHFDRTLISFDLRTKNLLEETWTYEHQGSADPMSLSLLKVEGRASVLFNSGYDLFTVVDLKDGKNLKGFPQAAPATSLQNGFHLWASTADSDGDGKEEVLVVEPADRVHLFSSEGKHLKTWQKAGNFFGKPLVLKSPSGSGPDQIWLTGHRGLHLLEP